ncbi:phosphotransferase [Candidatus Vidania fulgoroideorum]
MAVITKINSKELIKFLKKVFIFKGNIYIKGIGKGTQNSNFIINTKKNKLVLTISETNRKTYMTYKQISIIGNNIKNIPKILRYKKKGAFFYYNRKISFISVFKKGKEPNIISKKLSYKVAKILSKIHVKLSYKVDYIRNSKNINSVINILLKHYKEINQVKRDFILKNIIFIKNHYKYKYYKLIPKGLCHCDIFTDNIIVNEREKKKYIIDFHLASIEPYIYDICIYINEWCFKKKLLHKNIIYFIIGYIKNRKIKNKEFKKIYIYLMITSFRFWATRVDIKHNKGLYKIYKRPYKYFYINNYLRTKREKVTLFFSKLSRFLSEKLYN